MSDLPLESSFGASTPSVRPGATDRGRHLWIDRLRVVLTALVIAHHAAITYGASGSWFFVANPNTSVGLSLFAAVNQAFFMGLFFMLAGLVAPGSLARKGRRAFIIERAVRLGIPVLAFGFVLGPLTASLAGADPVMLLGDFMARVARGEFVLGPMWFPATLLAFSLALALLPRLESEPSAAPQFSHWIALALLTGIAALAVRQIVPVGATVAGLQLGYFASYVVLFAIGVRAADTGWLDAIRARDTRAALFVALGAMPVLPLVLLSTEDPVFETGFSLPAVTYAFWEPLVALGAIAGLVAWARGSGPTPPEFWTRFSGHAYGAFVVHAPVLVAASRGLDELGVPPVLGFPAAVAVAVPCSFALSALVRRIQFVRRVL